jgi:hypothetical protein
MLKVARFFKQRSQYLPPTEKSASVYSGLKGNVEDSKTSRNMCEDLLGSSHKQAK